MDGHLCRFVKKKNIVEIKRKKRAKIAIFQTICSSVLVRRRTILLIANMNDAVRLKHKVMRNAWEFSKLPLKCNFVKKCFLLEDALCIH